MDVAMTKGDHSGGVMVPLWSSRSGRAVSTGAYPPPPFVADLHRGGGGLGFLAGHAPGTGIPTPEPGCPGVPPEAGVGQTRHAHMPWPGATGRGRCPRRGLGGGAPPTPRRAIHRDHESRRLRGRGISLRAGEGEIGDPQGELNELEQLARSLGILCQEVGEAVNLRGVGARDGGGRLARRMHAAPHLRQALTVHEHNDVHGPAWVYLLQCSVSDGGRKAGFVLAHIAPG